MSQRDRRPVPRLDLAPKLKRPLSLWNPLDYLRLLYWVFFFPQALRWYVEKFGGGFINPGEMTLRKSWDLLRQNLIQRQLLIQGLLLSTATLIFINLALGELFQGVSFDWFGEEVEISWFGVDWGILVGNVLLIVLGAVGYGVVFGVVLGIEASIALSLVSVTKSILDSVLRNIGAVDVMDITLFGDSVVHVSTEEVFDIALKIGTVMMLCIMWSGAWEKIQKIKGGEVESAAEDMMLLCIMSTVVVAMSVALGMIWGMRWNVIASGVVSGMFGGGVMTLRPESWLLGLPFALRLPQNRRLHFSHVTPLPLPSLFSWLKNWLRQDWETGLHNANQLLAYTFQFTVVIRAVNRVLAETPLDLVIFRVNKLAEAPYDWKLVRFASASLSQTLKLKVVASLLLLPNLKPLLQKRWVTETRLDTPARAAAAGFWHLHEREVDKAVKAFAVVRSLPYGEEMLTLAQTLAAFHEAKAISTIAALQIPATPKEPLLRSATWKAITCMCRIVEDVQVVQRSASCSARSFALNRAMGEFNDLRDKAKLLPEAERELIQNITLTWGEVLLQVAGEVGKISISEAVRNPYVVGDPVQGNLFVGREDLLSQIEELWLMGHQLQSVVLYGHRRMGKTSILKNAANCLEAPIKVVYVNLLSLGNISQGVGEMLMAITDEIARTINIPAPDDADLLNLPYRTFERYLKQVDAQLGEEGLIIALDEFEQIEEFIAAGQIHQDFIKFLRGLVQMSSKVAFVFAGLHTLEEMTEDYFHPFFASIIPIHVGFLTPQSTHQLLANPNEDFPLDYSRETLNRIYTLTAGQPYLIQLVGFWLVRRYNNQVFEQRHPRDPVFTVEDVEAVINDPKFYKQGRYYFTGVWSQAEQGAYGQQAILKAIAPHPEGLSMDALAQATGMKEETLHKALETLKRHDVIKETERRWHIIVELFRRWVLNL